ncbi:MAG: ribosome silencing factor [bacterium]
MELKGLSLVKAVLRSISRKQAQDIIVLDMRGLSAIADFFIICTGNSSVHLKALADAMEIDLKKRKRNSTGPYKIHGYNSETWILYDYIDVVVHIFKDDARGYYAIEKLWSDAIRLDTADIFKQRKQNSS